MQDETLAAASPVHGTLEPNTKESSASEQLPAPIEPLAHDSVPSSVNDLLATAQEMLTHPAEAEEQDDSSSDSDTPAPYPSPQVRTSRRTMTWLRTHDINYGVWCEASPMEHRAPDLIKVVNKRSALRKEPKYPGSKIKKCYCEVDRQMVPLEHRVCAASLHILCLAHLCFVGISVCCEGLFDTCQLLQSDC